MSEEYIHGYSSAEMQRLTRMQDILNEAELAMLNLNGVKRLLDIGSGLGQMTRAFARTLGQGSTVLGIEREAQQLSEAKRRAKNADEAGRVEFRLGDATALPLAPHEHESFDLVHARFLLEHVRDPLAVVMQMVKAVRPGGRIALLDDDHELLRFWPECPDANRVWSIYWRSYAHRGLDPLIGRRMPDLLRKAGARPSRITTVFYGSTHGLPLFDLVVDNLVDVLEGAAEELDRSGLLELAEMDEAIVALNRWRSLDSATVWYSLPLAEGVK